VARFSPSHFKSLFKQAVGMPVHRFVLERRIKCARARLIEGGKIMTETALEAGFAQALQKVQTPVTRSSRHHQPCVPAKIAVSPEDRLLRTGNTPCWSNEISEKKEATEILPGVKCPTSNLDRI